MDAGRTADLGPVVLERRTISAVAEDTGGVMLVIVALALLLTLLWAFVRSRMGPPRLGSP